MTSHTHYLWFNTKSRQEIIDITDEVAEQVRESGVAEGLALVSAMHISASVFVNDHEPGLWADILEWLETRVAPWDPEVYRHHRGTGEDNAAAQLRLLQRASRSTRAPRIASHAADALADRTSVGRTAADESTDVALRAGAPA